eukprot:CAMPEP_0171097122 /NCGR_PEP_ID=MMETSP0766_2-20121228/47022_1 /TAXON_ID=439317 /ORGANISM="Gambierdiscus australes, Strain CAWD 149" /LENGTH=241 /DNA_ID=CAMNT_0011556265 /DNA_START=53 /DNA_END=781 /DNA_ORIENTATION=-
MSDLANAVEPLLIHAEAGDLEAIRLLDESDLRKKLRKRDEDGRTSLHRACANGHQEIAEFLLSKGADPNVEDEEGWVPLHSCASKGDAALVDLLLTAKADANASTSSGSASLHFAASKGHVDVVQLLLNSGAKRNAQDKHGGTAVLRAASCGKAQVLKLLLDAKADVKAKDRLGDNVLHVAINGQHIAVCEILMGHAEAEAMIQEDNGEGKTPAELLFSLQPIEVRDTIRSVWRAAHGGGG